MSVRTASVCTRASRSEKRRTRKPLPGDPVRTTRVMRTLILVPAAVEFDDQHAVDAAEIDDVRTDRMLAAELHAQLMPAQVHPEPVFGVSLLAAQLTCSIA